MKKTQDKIACGKKDQYIPKTSQVHAEKIWLLHTSEVSAWKSNWNPTKHTGKTQRPSIDVGTHWLSNQPHRNPTSAHCRCISRCPYKKWLAENTTYGNFTEGFRCVLLGGPPLKEQRAPAAELRLWHLCYCQGNTEATLHQQSHIEIL